MSEAAETVEPGVKSSELKIAILGNCQMGHLTRCLQALLGGDWPTNEWINFEILAEMADGRRDLTAYFARHDLVFMQPWIWKGLANRYPHERHKVVLYPYIDFIAYHPDLVYVVRRDNGEPFVGPGGHYQSSLALLGWKAGLTVLETLLLYRSQVYRKLGFFDYWESSCAGVLTEGQEAGLPLDSMLEGWIERGCFMHSVNHPKLFVIADIAKALLQRLGIGMVPGNPLAYVRDILADSVVWPVYPEIAESRGQAGSYSFKLSAPGMGPDFPVRTLGLKEFVEGSFTAFSGHAPDELGCSRLDLPPYSQLFEELRQRKPPTWTADVAAFRKSQDSANGSASTAGGPAHDPLRLEEARQLFKPEFAFHRPPSLARRGDTGGRAL